MTEYGYEQIYAQTEQIMSILFNHKSNYIFGCGWMGKKTLRVMQLLGAQIEGFIVSQKTNTCEEGIPVYEIGQIPEGDKNIFVALRDQDLNLNKKLESAGNIVLPVTYPKDLAIMEAVYYLHYLKERDVDCSRNILETGEFRFLNPFMQSYDYLLSWVYEAGDLILPAAYNDFVRVDEGPYETELTRLAYNDVVFDCGANIGLFSSTAVQKGCMVYAFEPMPAALQYLEGMRKACGDKLVICPYALNDYVGQAAFHVQNHDLLGASLLQTANLADQDYTVDVMTIDEYVHENGINKVDYIKADIEGAERGMLKGAAETIRRFAPKLSICTYHLQDDPQVLEERIREINPDYVIRHKWKKLYASVRK